MKRIIFITLLLLLMARSIKAQCYSLVDDEDIGTYGICADPTPNNGLCGWPSEVTVTGSGVYNHPWGYVYLDRGDWIQAEYHGDEPITIAMVELGFWTNQGSARVLVDGKAVWSGDTNVASYSQGSWKWVRVACLGAGPHTIKVENITPAGIYYDDITVYRFGFKYLENDEDQDGVADDRDPCPNSTLEAPFTRMQVDKFGCTPNQNLRKLLDEFYRLNLRGRKSFATENLANGPIANLCWNFNAWGADQNITGTNHYLGALFINRDSTGGISCDSYQVALVDWLVQMRNCKKVIDPGVNASRTYADLFGGLDFAPVKAWAPTAALGHKAAVVYFSGYDWKKGIVLDPWPTQGNKDYPAASWADTLFWYGAPDDSERWQGDFPLTGGSGYNYSPTEAPGLFDKIEEMYDKFKSSGLTECKVDLQLTDKKTGKRAGFFNNTFVNEIPNAYIAALCPGSDPNDKTWSFLLPTGTYDLTINGKGSDQFTFRASYKGKGIYTYGTHSITSGKKAVVTLDANNPTNPMTLPGGSQVTPTLEEGKLSLSRSSLFFTATTSGYKTGAQTFGITNLETGVLNWTVASNVSWLNCDPQSGSGNGEVSVSVDSTVLTGLMAGTYTGTLTISDPGASNSPLTIPVTLTVYAAGQTQAPFGDFNTPLEGSNVCSSIAVTGWALDDIGVQSVKIYSGSNYIGDAVFIEGARDDIAGLYPNYPLNFQAGWGYMMLTNFLPGGGNGGYTFYAVATDMEGNQVTLGSKTITVDNQKAVNPFGAIDTPGQGGSATGSSFKNQGWVLTPLPNQIPVNGSTIDVYVDGVKKGNPQYNIPRSDIMNFFPGYANSSGPAASFTLDTTAYSNGIHSIFWIARDNAGNSDGIGSRFFKIQNSGAGGSLNLSAASANPPTVPRVRDLDKIPVDCHDPIRVRVGFREGVEYQSVYPDERGVSRIEIRELERVEVQLAAQEVLQIKGFRLTANGLGMLPPGTTLDIKTGTFYWQAGPGFVGEYTFIFIVTGRDGEVSRKNILVDIKPKFK